MAKNFHYIKHREYQREYHKTRYDRLKAEGRCVGCAVPMNGDAHSSCHNCRAYYNRMQKERYHAKKEVAVNG